MQVDEKYDYLIRIPIYNLTLDQVEALDAEKQKADAEIERIRELDVKQWWNDDIDEFVVEYNKLTKTGEVAVKKRMVKPKGA
jgi:DNA topoisomerase-2